MAQLSDGAPYVWNGMTETNLTGYMATAQRMFVLPRTEVRKMTRRESIRYRIGCVKREAWYRIAMATSALKGEL